jgi:glucose uptake protein GlcU
MAESAQPAVGFAAAIAAAVFNGSFAVLAKTPAVKRSAIEPVAFNALCCAGVALSSCASLPLLRAAGIPLGLSGYGCLAGSLFVLSALFSFVAVSAVGVSVAQGVWGGSAIVIAYMWGAVGPAPLRAPLHSAAQSALALALLLLGVVGIACSSEIAALVGGRAQIRRETSLLAARADADAETDELAAADAAPPQASPPCAGWWARAAGIGSALLVGVFGGSTLAPLAFVRAELRGFGVLPSFGLGVLGAGALVTAAHAGAARRRGERVVWGGTAAVPAGLASGVVWSAGNCCAIYAISYAGLSYGIAYPIVQCALLVSGLLGICALRELTEPVAIGVFFAAAVVLVAGGALLGCAGPGGSGCGQRI